MIGTNDVVFTREYYDEVWGDCGGVHRHDYCEYWANRLITESGAGSSVLDIGTGCGYLVKRLREKGCDAWGVDSSDYAIANTCAQGYVLNASVTDLPFKDERFDVVSSNGLWEYVSEADVPKGRDEIWRVGSKQLHQIDHSGTDFREDFVTWKSIEWWNEQLAAPKVLVSCPTYEMKEYAHQAWIDAVRKIDYPNFDIFVVDNSATEDCYNRWKDKMPMAHVDTTDISSSVGLDAAQRMARSMEVVRKKFLADNYKWWFNVEIDVIIEPTMLKALLRYGKDCDWIAHTYPARGEIVPCCSGLGCSVWSRRLIEAFEFETAGDFINQGVDSHFWRWFLEQNKYTCVEYWCVDPIHHLKEPDG